MEVLRKFENNKIKKLKLKTLIFLEVVQDFLNIDENYEKGGRYFTTI